MWANEPRVVFVSDKVKEAAKKDLVAYTIFRALSRPLDPERDPLRDPDWVKRQAKIQEDLWEDCIALSKLYRQDFDLLQIGDRFSSAKVDSST